MSKLVSKVEEITPAKAAEFLKKNIKNRPQSRATIKKYARIMKAGRWALNGEPIILSENGTLVDGQHRLQGVILSNTPVSFLLVTGVPENSFKTVDVGKKRTGADAISTYDERYEKNRASIAACAKIAYSFDKYGEFDSNRDKLENDDLIDFVDKNKGMLRSVEYTMTLHTARKVCPVSALSAMHYLFSKKDIDLAEKFFHKLNSGENMKKDEPINLLRNRLFVMTQETGVIRAREVIPYLVKTWELMRDGREVERLVVPKDYKPVIK